MRLPAAHRLVDEAECVCSVLLAVLLAHRLGAANANWAAFSGYMVMRGHWADSLSRGVLRIVGTVAGAGLALVAVPWLAGPVGTPLLAALVGGGTLYCALAGRHAYAWLFTGLTFLLILFDAGDTPPAPFAANRVLEVATGTAACVLVSAVSAVTLRRRWPATRAPAATALGWHPPAIRHAAQGAVAVALVALLAGSGRLHQPGAAAVSVMASMLLPASAIGTSGLGPVSRKLAQRVAGCLAGALLAAGVLLVAHGSPAWLLAGAALGVALGRHLENSGHALAYVGTQFVLAVLVALVPDRPDQAMLAPALERLTGIVAGLLVLEPVLVVWHLAAPRRGAKVMLNQSADIRE